MEKFFKLKQNGTRPATEVIAGLTTFFAMAYILIVNPQMLSQTGIPAGAVFLATVFAAAIGTLFMGLFANVPYALAPGMGLNAFFTYSVCFALGFTWQQGLAMVFICGLVNVVITVTKIRKLIIRAIPAGLQHAIGGGIGVFIAYIGLQNSGLINFRSGLPALSDFNTLPLIFALVSLVLMIVLVALKIPGAIFISIVGATLIGIPFGVTHFENIDLFAAAGNNFAELGNVFGKAVTEGLPSLFENGMKVPLVLGTIFAFSLTDTFDTLGTFIGTGRRTGIFNAEDQKKMQTSSGFKSKMDKALFADSVATSVGAILGTTNTTTYVESAAGIGAGGRTGLTAVVTGAAFLFSSIFSPLVSVVPGGATAPALIIVGIMMTASFADVKWGDLSEAIPAFFAGIFMALCYSISYGIAAGFIFYCVVKLCSGKVRDIHPVIWVTSLLFLLNFIILAVF
ncbi:guanine permease [Clostridia bacterium]|nr:guanine permease [Clostridia bacterium]